MTVINNATLILKDSQGNEGIVKSFTDKDITKISNAITDVGQVVDPATHMPIKATTASVGVVQLATAQDITNGTAGKVVDAKELSDAITDKATKAEVAEIAEKSNAITVADTAPNVANMPVASGVMHPSQNIITENPDVSILALQQNLWAYDSTKTYAVGSYVFDENKDICKCIQANGPTNIHAPSDSAYWLKLGGNALIPNQTITSELPLTDANLHLKDGALLSGSGSYADYVSLIAQIYTSGSATDSFCTEAEWQTSNTNYGFCNKFVYDSVANTVRLPKINSEHGALIKSYSSSSDWYRIYQDGWCEQGGRVFPTTANSTWNLIRPFANTNYVIVGSDCESDKVSQNSFVPYSATQFSVSTSVANYTKAWTACGYIDISDLQVSPIYEYIVIGTVSKTDIEIYIDNVLVDLANKADKDFSNVTAPVQAFKNMTIGWSMPDWSSVITITSHFTTANGSFTAPSDGYIQVLRVGDNYAYIYNKPNMASTTTDNAFIHMDGSNGDGVFVYAFVPISKGQTIYQTSSGGFRPDAGRINFIPCKGAN